MTTPPVPPAVGEPPLTDDELAEIEARAEAATEGPWTAEYSGETGNCVLPPGYESAREYVARTQLYLAVFDAKFIAAARTDVPRLVAALRAAREELAALKATPRGERFERIATAVDAASYAIHDTRTLGRPLSDVEIASIAIDAAYDVLRRTFAEEASAALEAKSGISYPSYARAAEIVRQIGGADRDAV